MEPCNLCGGTQWTMVEEEASTQIVRCSCGLIFVTPQPPRPVLEQAYEQDYYSPWDEQTALRAGIWRSRLEQVEAFSPVRGDLLDVGCGTGTFLEVARKAGWRVTGTEFSAYACRAAKKRGLPVHNGEVWDAGLPPGSMDVVTCWHVIEHVTDPKRVVQEIYRVLRPGGWLVLATPNVRDHLFRIAYRIARGQCPRLYEADERELHLFHFSAGTLRALLSSRGFRSIEIGFDRGAAAVWSKRLVNELAYAWFMLTGLHWGMALTAAAVKPSTVP
jgi:2-polyprenyl-3-methyl-5-hydroxy-6-metoxy-1,4-benzoquinol methylase